MTGYEQERGIQAGELAAEAEALGRAVYRWAPPELEPFIDDPLTVARRTAILLTLDHYREATT